MDKDQGRHIGTRTHVHYLETGSSLMQVESGMAGAVTPGGGRTVTTHIEWEQPEGPARRKWPSQVGPLKKQQNRAARVSDG